MDLNEFIFRDDSVVALGAVAEIDDDFAVSDEAPDSEKAGFSAIGSAVLSLSHLLAHGTKSH